MKNFMKSAFILSCFMTSCAFCDAVQETKPVMTPEIAFKDLVEGNNRYIEDRLEHPNRTPERREALNAHQNPFATVIGCSDSRVSPEIIFDQGIGDIFVVRVAGNVVGPIELASVQYSVEYLKSSIVMVLGHENCGAVQAVVAGKTKDIEPIAEKIQAAIKLYAKPGDSPIEAAVKANVVAVTVQLRAVPVLDAFIKEKKLKIVGGYYNLTTGKVEICCGIND